MYYALLYFFFEGKAGYIRNRFKLNIYYKLKQNLQLTIFRCLFKILNWRNNNLAKIILSTMYKIQGSVNVLFA